MTDTPPQETPPQAASMPVQQDVSREPQSIIIRPWPKVVFLYPTFIASTAFWIMSWLGTESEQGYSSFAPWMGNAFVAVLFLNFLVFAFDFSRIKSITIIFGIIAAVFALFWANTQWEVMGFLSDWGSAINIQANTWFYGAFSLMMGFILLTVLINTRFNYYEINHREILHHHGYLGDVTRMPTAGLRLNKEIYDLMEFLLLKSGRLIFYPSTSQQAIVIDNVLNVNHAEDRIKDLLSVIAVRVADMPQTHQ